MGIELVIRGQRITISEARVLKIWANIEKRGEDECWLWQGTKNSGGYGTVGLKLTKGVYVNRSIHQVIYALEHGPTLPADFILHSCDNPPCCNPKHLSRGSPQDNTSDMVAKDRHIYGIKSKNAKFDPPGVVNVLSLHRLGLSGEEIGRRLGKNPRYIRSIINGDVWKKVHQAFHASLDEDDS